MYSLSDVGAVFTCCLFPEMTERAVASVLGAYPNMQAVVVVDACAKERPVLDVNISVVYNDRRIGTGRSLDRGLRLLDTPLFLSVDHGVEIKERGLVEHCLTLMEPDIIGAGMKRTGKDCTRAFGPYIDPVFALWNRKLILAHPDLSFRLTHIRMGDWQVNGCSTAQLLLYRALAIGYRPAFVGRRVLERHVRHYRTPRTRGRNASPHELVAVEPGYLTPRQRNRDGSLRYEGAP